MIKLHLKDGSIREVEAGESVYEVAKEISEGLARNATCASVDGKVVCTAELMCAKRKA